MASLTLRALGMSYLVEGLPRAGLDAESLCQFLERAYGPAAGRMGFPPEALIVDRKAAPWPNLLDQLSAWVRNQGYSQAYWCELTPPLRATLELGPP
jgi:hypothetical protein